MIHSNDRLVDIAFRKEREGCVKELKSQATAHVVGRPGAVLRTYQAAYKAGHINPELEITVVAVTSGALIFEDVPENVELILEAVSPKMKSSLPDIVLSKMVGVRMLKLRKIIMSENEIAHSHAQYTKATVVPMVVPQFETLQQLRDWCTSAPGLPYNGPFQTYDNRYEIVKFKRKVVKELLKIPNLRDEHVVEGMKLSTIADVMEE